tara:strand:+ start:1141 stop:1530 length:390 start_codon:yes stop_codon:yes gene_type:complete
MKNYTKRKTYSSSRKINTSSRGSADSPYLQTNGNSNGFKRGNKNPKDQYNDFLNKAKDAKGQGDEVLEQFYLQHAEHYFRQLENSNKGAFSRKIINREKIDKDDDGPKNNNTDKESAGTDFDDLASQLA